MSRPGSARPALTVAVVAALVGDTTLTTALGGQKAWVNVPEQTKAPYLWVLGAEEVPIERSMKDARRRAVAVEITAVSGYRGTTEIDALLSRVIEVLTPEAEPGPAVTGYTARWEFVVNRKPVLAERQDGSVGWEGTAVFEVQLT